MDILKVLVFVGIFCFVMIQSWSADSFYTDEEK